MPQGCNVYGCRKLSVSKGLCDTHRKRRDRHGHVEQTRPADWGAREKHPAYGVWRWLCRFHNPDLPEKWRDDFWAFVGDTPEKPKTKCSISRIDEAKPWSAENFYWREPRVSLDGLADRALYQREYHRRMRALDPDYGRDRDFKKRYGVDLAWFNDRLEKQDHKCAICEKPESLEIKGKVVLLAVDHCHDTGKVRGLLCANCNRGLGHLKHDQLLLLRAVEYLEETD